MEFLTQENENKHTMPSHHERRELPYEPAQLFELVLDIESYERFLPWCGGARILKRDKEARRMEADLVITFKGFRETYTSAVTYEPPGQKPGEAGSVDVQMLRGPFKYLKNHWRFIPNENGTTTIDFFVDFTFRSKLLEKLIGMMFSHAVEKMVSAFEAEARRRFTTGA